MLIYFFKREYIIIIITVAITIILILFNLDNYIDFADDADKTSSNYEESLTSPNYEGSSSSDKYTESSSSQEKTNSSEKSNRAKEFEAKMAKLMISHMDTFLDNIREEIEEESKGSDELKKEELRETYYDQVDYLQEMNKLVNDLDKELTIKDKFENSENSELKRNAEEELEKDKKKKRDNNFKVVLFILLRFRICG